LALVEADIEVDPGFSRCAVIGIKRIVHPEDLVDLLIEAVLFSVPGADLGREGRKRFFSSMISGWLR
jgi:hypothetical protein